MNAKVQAESPGIAEQSAVGTSEMTGEFDSLLRAAASRSPLKPREATEIAATSMCIGRIASIDVNGTAYVEFAGSSMAVAARLGFPASIETLRTARHAEKPAILLLENGDPALPIIMGFIQTPADRPVCPSTDEASLSVPGARGNSANDVAVVEADVDGKRVRVVAKDEIVLQCGQASVTLRRNGRVVIRGTYVETYSEGTNRIKGGQVRIN